MLCLLSNTLFAGSSLKLCDNHRVKIYNETAYDCTLTDHHLLVGKLTNDTVLPEVIFKGESASIDVKTTLNEFHHVGVLLTYQCGQGNVATLYSMGYAHRYDGVLVNSKALDVQNLAVSFKHKKEDCNDWLSSSNYNTVSWTLKNS
jgi:hypothetical protein